MAPSMKQEEQACTDSQPLAQGEGSLETHSIRSTNLFDLSNDDLGIIYSSLTHSGDRKAMQHLSKTLYR
eukprot:208104-Pelagomonas_calceolata.AAC.1